MSKRKDEETELWEQLVRETAPLKGRLRKPVTAAPKPSSAPVKPVSAASSPRPASKPPKPAPPAAFAVALNRHTKRELQSGKLQIEARLDLHGLRQRDAYANLHRFLVQAQARSLRHVLVITGKGSQPASRNFYAEEEHGVLKQAVPRWLASPDFAALVVTFSPAPRRLGGEGALYVRLRKKKLQT
jgi:DNA-nicking Smr family endonuclease